MQFPLSRSQPPLILESSYAYVQSVISTYFKDKDNYELKYASCFLLYTKIHFPFHIIISHFVIFLFKILLKMRKLKNYSCFYLCLLIIMYEKKNKIYYITLIINLEFLLRRSYN
jgi:hypothetical protein